MKAIIQVCPAILQSQKWPKIIVLFLGVFLLSCNSTPDKTQSAAVTDEAIPNVIAQNDSLDAVVKSIVKISALDFFKNQQPLPVGFKDVHIKYNIKPNNEVLYLLCGMFTTGDNEKNSEWIHFTTIKNSDYEQWIGPSGLTFCENSKEIPYTKTDLSIDLINELSSLTKKDK